MTNLAELIQHANQELSPAQRSDVVRGLSLLLVAAQIAVERQEHEGYKERMDSTLRSLLRDTVVLYQ